MENKYWIQFCRFPNRRTPTGRHCGREVFENLMMENNIELNGYIEVFYQEQYSEVVYCCDLKELNKARVLYNWKPMRLSEALPGRCVNDDNDIDLNDDGILSFKQLKVVAFKDNVPFEPIILLTDDDDRVRQSAKYWLEVCELFPDEFKWK